MKLDVFRGNQKDEQKWTETAGFWNVCHLLYLVYVPQLISTFLCVYLQENRWRTGRRGVWPHLSTGLRFTPRSGICSWWLPIQQVRFNHTWSQKWLQKCKCCCLFIYLFIAYFFYKNVLIFVGFTNSLLTLKNKVEILCKHVVCIEFLFFYFFVFYFFEFLYF